MMGKLVEVNPGVWIHPEQVTGVVVFNNEAPCKPYLVLRLGKGNSMTWDCDTLEKAHKLADKLATKINEVSEP